MGFFFSVGGKRIWNSPKEEIDRPVNKLDNDAELGALLAGHFLSTRRPISRCLKGPYWNDDEIESIKRNVKSTTHPRNVSKDLSLELFFFSPVAAVLSTWIDVVFGDSLFSSSTGGLIGLLQNRPRHPFK